VEEETLDDFLHAVPPEDKAAVAQAQAAGFTVTDPATGVLPGTRIATVQGSELAGLNMQLLQYV
jgi:hypothetical protein